MTSETGIVTDEVVYMTADVEDKYIVAQANEPLDENGPLRKQDALRARDRDEIIEVEASTHGLIWTFRRRWWFPLRLR